MTGFYIFWLKDFPHPLNRIFPRFVLSEPSPKIFWVDIVDDEAVIDGITSDAVILISNLVLGILQCC